MNYKSKYYKYNFENQNSTSSKDFKSLYYKYNFENQNSTSDTYKSKYYKYKNKYLNLKNQFAGSVSAGESKAGESKAGESKAGESKAGESKSSENFLDRPHLVAIVRYTEQSEGMDLSEKYNDVITEILFSDGKVYKAETYFDETDGWGDITKGYITLQRTVDLHQKEYEDIISFLGGIGPDYYEYETIEDFYQKTPGIDIYLTKKYKINGKYKSKILFNKVLDSDRDTDYYKSITGNMISLEGDKPSVGNEFNIVEIYEESPHTFVRFTSDINVTNELMHIDEYIEEYIKRQIREDYMGLGNDETLIGQTQNIVKQIGDGLNFVHNNKLIHNKFKKNNIPCKANQIVKECNEQPNCTYSTLKGCTEKEDPNKNNPASPVFNVGKNDVRSFLFWKFLMENIEVHLVNEFDNFDYENGSSKYWDDNWDEDAFKSLPYPY